MEYYLSNGNGQKEGPFTLEELKGKITNRNTLVWCEGMSAWTPVTQVPALDDLVQGLASETGQTTNAGPVPPYANYAVPPKTWLVESILATIFCCLPFGIVGIVYATKVESTFLMGNQALAESYSRQAKTWTLVSLGIGIAGIAMYILYFVVILGVTAAGAGAG